MFQDVVGSDEDLAWAAGVFDGEGSTLFEKGYLQLRVPQAGAWDQPPDVLRRFWEAMGGIGSISGPYPPRKGNLPQWKYAASGPKACDALRSMWPFLGRVKRVQAVNAIAHARPSQKRGSGEALLAYDESLESGSLPLCMRRVDRRRRGTQSGARLGEAPNTIELAWAAGFFDGEGSTFTQQKRRYPKISVSQNGDREGPPQVLVRFRQALLEMGNFDGPIFEQGRIKWHYTVHGHDLVQAAIALMWPWLSGPKRDQAVNALMACRAQGRPRRRPGHRRGRPLNERCKRGHDYSEVAVDRYGRRTCKPCRNLLAREGMRRQRAQWRSIRGDGTRLHGSEEPRRKKPCKRGHDPTDVFVNSAGRPECRPCKNLRDRARRAGLRSSVEQR